MRRRPDFAGSFYPGEAESLKRMIEEMIPAQAVGLEAKAVVSPHAGYAYSGPVAGAVFSSVRIPEECVVLCPSHRGIRPMFGIMSEGTWGTPLGDVPLASELAVAIKRNSDLVVEDAAAHEGEHSLEVQVPFIRFLRPDVSIVPIIVSHRAGLRELEELGWAVASGIRGRRSGALVVASTDMSHFLSQEEARRKDFLAIGRILELDPGGLFETVQDEGISMCGFQPTVAAMAAARELGATKAELVMYQTSGETSGDYSRVVGYAGLRLL